MTSDKTAIERTQELLDERGVKHVGNGGMVRWTNGDGCVCRAYTRLGDQSVDVAIMDASPEQAIAATLGRGTCHKLPQTSDAICVVHRGDFSASFGYWTCSECGVENFDGAKYCMNCGRKVVDA